MKKPFILFDFDGVISDSFVPAFKIHQAMHPHTTEEEYRRAFEGNINNWNIDDNVHTKDCKPELDFFDEYSKALKVEVKLIPGIKEVVSELAKVYSLVIISSTLTELIQTFLIDHGMDGLFLELMGNDVHPSKEAKIKMVFAKYGLRPDECIFITDTLGDLREAEAVGVGAIGVRWGFSASNRLEQGKSFRLLDKPEELPGTVRDYFERKS